MSEGTLEKLERKLLRNVGRASREFGLIEANDRIMVCLSGGKDSYAMLELLAATQTYVPFTFSMVAVNLDQKQPGFPEHILPEYLQAKGYDYRIVERDTYSVVIDKVPEGKTYCSLCSRLRRGILYNTAVELGATKIALGHHRDDILETTLLNLFYSGQLKAMPPKLQSDDGRNVVIRPLAYCAEEDIAEYARLKAFPIIPCDLCGSQDNLKRQQIKRLITELHTDNDNVRGNMLNALRNVRVSHLLDTDLWERVGLDLGIPKADGALEDEIGGFRAPETATASAGTSSEASEPPHADDAAASGPSGGLISLDSLRIGRG